MKNIEGIFIVAGHSKYNPGAKFEGLIERDLVKEITSNLFGRLEKIQNIETRIIGFEDLSLEDKADEINYFCKMRNFNLENSIVIEIHCNANKGTGIESLGYKGYVPFQNLSNILLNNTVKTTGLRNRGLKNGDQLHIINKTTPLALIFECGFIDTEKDRKVLTEDITSFSDGIYNGLKEYIGFEEEIDYKKKYEELKVKMEKINLLSE